MMFFQRIILILAILAMGFSVCTVQGQTDELLPENFGDWEVEMKYQFLDSLVGFESRHDWSHIRYAIMGYQMASDEGDQVWLAKFASALSKKYREAGLYEQAKSYALDGIEAARRSGDPSAEAAALVRLAGCNNELDLPGLAAENCEDALAIARSIGDSAHVGWAYNMLGEIQRMHEQPEAALPYYEHARRAFQSIGKETGAEIIQHNLAITYVDLGDFEAAQKWFSMPISKEFRENDLRIFEEGIAQSKIYEQQGRISAAVKLGEEFLKKASDLTPKWHAIWLARMAELERQQGNIDRAWEFREQAFELEEQILGEDVKTKSSMLDVQFGLREAEARNLLLEQEYKTQRWITIGLFVILGLIFGLALLFVSANRRIRRQNEEIAQRNAQLDDLIEDKDMLMNIMAHDLKAPLSSISGLLDLIEAPQTPDSIRDKTVTHIRRSVAKGTEIISSLLELAELENQKVKTVAESFSLSDLLREAGEDFRPAAEKKSISLSLDLPPEDIAIDSDPHLLRRVIDNLVSNALKYSEPGKRVEIKLEAEAAQTKVSVIDQGLGIPADEQGRLFLKFQKLSARPTAGESSTGLGLSIVKAIADQLGAHLEVKSQPGFGSTFSISLPPS